MKTLTTLTAAAALIAGMSIGNAQGSSSMSKDKSMGADSSAKVIGSSKFCAKTSSGALNCTFASMEACQKDAKGDTCTTNPQESSTTGAGANTK